MAKPSVTRTMGPIHFEDLEPHRFEDLVRELLYDYKDWQSIEATGRSGTDGGFDARAYEKNYNQSDSESSDFEIEEERIDRHPMNGNLWMIQCKREAEIGPAKVKTIINENITNEAIPYGYILVAPANFSKKSYDTFREELIKKGVMEFYLWGRAALEDMLHMPKYDRVLFTFFGISLVARQRTRTTELRSRIAVKNKLYKILGEERPVADVKILLRDINDDNCPVEPVSQNGKKGWLRYYFAGNHVLGIWVQIADYYGYFDKVKNEWDISRGIDLNTLYEDGETDDERVAKLSIVRSVKDFWERLRKATQSRIAIWGLVEFQDIRLIDEKGDPKNKMLHLYVDFKYDREPFSRIIHVVNEKLAIESVGAQRTSVFPATIDDVKPGKIYTDKTASIPEKDFKILDSPYVPKALFEKGNQFSFLKPGDKIQLLPDSGGGKPKWIEVTNVYSTTIKEYEKANEGINAEHFINSQLKSLGNENDSINVYEYQTTYV